jgi:hypothetical protein
VDFNLVSFLLRRDQPILHVFADIISGANGSTSGNEACNGILDIQDPCCPLGGGVCWGIEGAEDNALEEETSVGAALHKGRGGCSDC